MSEVRVGDTMPSFKSLNEAGNLVSSEDMLGTKSVIYFYPKDDTPGCTKEACGFRDYMEELDARGVIVIGISPDNSDSHQKFINKYELNFGLLSDPQLDVAKKFGAIKESDNGRLGIERSTYIVDEKGIIRWIERGVQVEGHTERVLKALDSL